MSVCLTRLSCSRPHSAPAQPPAAGPRGSLVTVTPAPRSAARGLTQGEETQEPMCQEQRRSLGEKRKPNLDLCAGSNTQTAAPSFLPARGAAGDAVQRRDGARCGAPTARCSGHGETLMRARTSPRARLRLHPHSAEQPQELRHGNRTCSSSRQSRSRALYRGACGGHPEVTAQGHRDGW